MTLLPTTPEFQRMMLYKIARTLAGLTVRDLSVEAGVSTNTLTRLESGEELKPATVRKIRAALEAHGVEFVPHPTWAEWVQPRAKDG
ncbi:helix-turn-helix domain-containing protein [Salinarimonas ramus]|nr:helix-turn-helix transcriptional regulator [Salinarimonas ramus]